LLATAKQLDSQAYSLGIAIQRLASADNLTAAVYVDKIRVQIGTPGQCFDQGLQEAIVMDNVPHIQDAAHCVSLARPCTIPHLYSGNMQDAHPCIENAPI